MVGERSELLCLVSCIYLFFNKYNWLCVLGAIVRQRKPGAETGLLLLEFFVINLFQLYWYEKRASK